MLIKTDRFEVEITGRLIYLHADIGRRHLCICKVWRDAWRHMDFDWYVRAERDEELRLWRDQRLAELEKTDPEEAAFWRQLWSDPVETVATA